MGANSTQGVALVIFLVAFTCLSTALFSGGNLLLLLLFLVGIAASIALFVRAKPWEHAER